MVKHTQIIRRHSQQFVGLCLIILSSWRVKGQKRKIFEKCLQGCCNQGKSRRKGSFSHWSGKIRESQGILKRSGKDPKMSGKIFQLCFFFRFMKKFVLSQLSVPLKNASVTPRISNLCLLTILSAKVQQNTILLGFYFFTLSSARSSMNCFRWGW